jgi:hypothetical protein
VTDSPKDLAKEADRGRSERTPFIALTGVTIAVGAFVIALLVVVFLVYYLVM